MTRYEVSDCLWMLLACAFVVGIVALAVSIPKCTRNEGDKPVIDFIRGKPAWVCQMNVPIPGTFRHQWYVP